jgi:GT2 family glycosyltransferase
MKVGVAMPCINLWERYTKTAINSARLAMNQAEKEGMETSFLLIDNASTDETQVGATELCKQDPRIEYQRNNEQWGFQRSVNFGANYFFEMGFDYVLVLNNDVTIHPKSIVNLIARMEKGDVVMATCMDVRGEMDMDEMKADRIGELSDVFKEKVPDSPHPNFSAFMMGVNGWKEIGEFDEIFEPAYYEDNDYHYRIKLAGKIAITHPPAMFYHYGSRTQMEALGRPLTESGNQHAQYIRKWGGSPNAEKYNLPFNNPANTIRTVRQGLSDK